MQFNCPLKTAFETYLLLIRFVRRAFHSFRVADGRFEHTAVYANSPYMFHRPSNWNWDIYSNYKAEILKDLVRLVTDSNEEDDIDEDKDVFRTAEKIFRRIMKRNISPK